MTAAAVLGTASTALQGLLVPMALLTAPGLYWARSLAAWRARSPTLPYLWTTASWFGVAWMVVEVSLVRELQLDPRWLLALAPLVTLLGAWLFHARGGDPRQLEPPADTPTGVRVGTAAVVVTVVAVAGLGGQALFRPLHHFWWDAGVQEAAASPASPPFSLDLPGSETVGWEGDGIHRATLPAGRHALTVQGSGRAVILVQGAVGLRATLLHRQEATDVAEVERDPVVREDEGAVPRYLDRGVAVLAASMGGSEPWALKLSSPATVWLLPSAASAWTLHGTGAMRFVHYYQILNLVENQRWAARTLEDLRLTVNQPPLWAYVLSVAPALVSPDLPGAAWLFLWVLLLAGVAGVELLAAVAPRAPMVAWTVPALAVALHARLMLEPGSINFPDNLYTAALLTGLAALVLREGGRLGMLTLAAGLLRYPGSLLLLGAGLAWRGASRRLVLPAAALLGLTGLVVLAAGAVTGSLSQWAHIVWFETFPEHWHGDHRLGSLLPRIPAFYARWMLYAGGTPLLALLAARGAARRLWWVALAYSLLLCTVDHFPTHYFLPLVHLSALSAAAAGAGRSAAWSWAAAAGLLLALLAAPVW